ncbi:MAG: hypothetical protein J7K40_15000 [candidate division Zixibacteria bacterium]|nr:hypothetical protein [candidate division Zixibacteria bacterium]
MKTAKWTVIIFGFTLILASACGDTVSKFPTNPAKNSGITDSEGEVILDLGSHIITVQTVNENGGTISSMNVSGFLLREYLYLVASGNDSYYPNYKMVPYEEIQIREDIMYGAGKTSSPQTVETIVEFVLIEKDRDIHSYYDEPEYYNAAYSDSWTTPAGYSGTLADVYTLMDTISYEGGIIIQISPNVASLTNTDTRTVSLCESYIASDTVFNVHVGLELNIFDADTLHINYMTYLDSLIPIIYIDSIVLVEGSFFAQFTLIWDENPGDLDSHLWTPEIEGSSYHIAYYSKGSASAAPYTILDVDDVTSWGPEHVAIYEGFPGTYTYAVHHFSGSSDIPNSGAIVSVLLPDRSVSKFTPPDTTASSGDYWHVCTIDGTTKAITEIGIISGNPPVTGPQTVAQPPKNY